MHEIMCFAGQTVSCKMDGEACRADSWDRITLSGTDSSGKFWRRSCAEFYCVLQLLLCRSGDMNRHKNSCDQLRRVENGREDIRWDQLRQGKGT